MYIPFALLGALMLFDEGYFHVRRGLPRWERIGHPVDSAVFMAALAWAAVCPAGGWSLVIFVALGLFSCVVITKDSDFYHSHLLHGKPWKLLLVRTGNIRTRELTALFDRHFPAIIAAFDRNSLVELDRQAVQIVA